MAELKSDGQSSNGQTKEIVSGENEIIERLQGYEDPEVTKQLYDFGKELVRDALDLVNWLDTKAGVFAGVAGGMIVVVISTFSSWKDLIKDFPSGSICLFFGLISLLLAAWSAIRALRIQTFQGLDEKNLWFAKEFLQHPDQLQRYYLIGMYRLVVSHDSINKRKALMLVRAERFVVAGATLLALPLLVETWRLGMGKELASLLNFFGGRGL
jgi:hypothetical protein